jgi:hypothetical protein
MFGFVVEALEVEWALLRRLKVGPEPGSWQECITARVPAVEVAALFAQLRSKMTHVEDAIPTGIISPFGSNLRVT